VSLDSPTCDLPSAYDDDRWRWASRAPTLLQVPAAAPRGALEALRAGVDVVVLAAPAPTSRFTAELARTGDSQALDRAELAAATDPGPAPSEVRAAESRFLELARTRALKRLEENSARLSNEIGRYRDPAQLAELRRAADQDRTLAERESELEARLGAGGRDDLRVHTSDVGPGLERATHLEIAAALEEVKAARLMLRRAHPALSVLDTQAGLEGLSDRELQATVTSQLQDIQARIADLSRRIASGAFGLAQCPTLIGELKAELGVSEDKRARGDLLSIAVLGWEERAQRVQTALSTAATVAAAGGFAAGALASGGASVVIGLASGAISGIAAGADWKAAVDCWSAAETSLPGLPELADRTHAQSNLIAATVNLVLASADLALAAKGAAGAYKAASLLERYAGAEGSTVLRKLTPGEVLDFHRAASLSAAGRSVEAQKILAGLAPGMKPEVFAEASAFFEARAETLRALARDLGPHAGKAPRRTR
jgi:hypothetical protein